MFDKCLASSEQFLIIDTLSRVYIFRCGELVDDLITYKKLVNKNEFYRLYFTDWNFSAS